MVDVKSCWYMQMFIALSLSLSIYLSMCVCVSCVQVWRCLNKMPMLLPYQDRNWLPAAANQVDTSREKFQLSTAQIGECSHLEMIYTSFCPTPFHLVQLTLRSLVDSSAVFHLPPAIQHLIKMNQFENKNKRTFHINKTYQLISISLMWKSEGRKSHVDILSSHKHGRK